MKSRQGESLKEMNEKKLYIPERNETKASESIIVPSSILSSKSEMEIDYLALQCVSFRVKLYSDNQWIFIVYLQSSQSWSHIQYAVGCMHVE